MRETYSAILEAFSGIVISIITALKHDLFYPRQPQTIEEKLSSQVKRRDALLASQQNRMVYQAGVIREQGLKLQEWEKLLTQKDKELQTMRANHQALELQLQESSRQERRR
jgi:hypothetical protein